jgi:uncharacterized protein YecA (UPF0149 family)
MQRIEVRLEDDVHETWEEHVDEDTRYKTMTQLIRFAVGEQIQRDRGEKSDAESLDPERLEQAVDESVDSLRTDIQSMRNDILQTQRVAESLADEEYHMSNAMELHDILPKVSSIEKAIDGADSGRVSDLENDFKENIDQDVTSSDIRIALARLENDVPQVSSEVIDGERVYYEKI